MLSNKALTEYKEIRKAETGVVPPESILTEEAIKLLVLFDYVYRPIKKVWLEEFISKNMEPIVAGIPRERLRPKDKPTRFFTDNEYVMNGYWAVLPRLCSILGLRVVDEITTYFKTTSNYHYIPNLKDGIYPLVRPTSEQLAAV